MRLPIEGTRHSISAGRSVLGRSRNAAIVVPDEEVSREHAVITRDEEGVCSISDLSSRNGTFVNGERIKGTVALQSGDRIQLGQHMLLFTGRTDVQQQMLQQQRFESVGHLGSPPGMGEPPRLEEACGILGQ